IRELTHRIVNDYSCIISIISLTAERSSNFEVKAALQDASELVRHFARLVHALQMPEHSTRIDGAEYLRELCLSVCRSKLRHLNIKLVLAARPLPMESGQCWRLGIILYELITNVARHAFDGGGGEIRIELCRSRSFIQCHVLDNGSAPESVEPGH